ncbi:MAG TPA: Crp/Fnr family transcriptional regulator [Candidatus Ruthenibacterium merdigallinarum]|nr:Crp/Fnr family transcriptional regulator [Candidatus Ruthenibacterium merdigallinarum]
MEECDLQMLRKTPLFAGMTPDEVKSALAGTEAQMRPFEKGEFLLRTGEPVRWVGLLMQGEALVMREDVWGKRSVLTTLAPGQLFAEALACAGTEESPVSVQATQSGRALLLRAQRLFDAGAQKGQAALTGNLMHIMAQKNLALNRKIEVLSRRTTREKLLAFLGEEARRAHGRTFAIPYNRQALADYLGVDRSAMCTELSRLKKEGWLDFHRSTFRLLAAGEESPVSSLE